MGALRFFFILLLYNHVPFAFSLSSLCVHRLPVILIKSPIYPLTLGLLSTPLGTFGGTRTTLYLDVDSKASDTDIDIFNLGGLSLLMNLCIRKYALVRISVSKDNR
jgi:hypothetical protein